MSYSALSKRKSRYLFEVQVSIIQLHDNLPVLRDVIYEYNDNTSCSERPATWRGRAWTALGYFPVTTLAAYNRTIKPRCTFTQPNDLVWMSQCDFTCCVAASTLAVHNSLWTELRAKLQHAAWCSWPSGWLRCCCILRAATWAVNVNAWRLPRLTNSCCLSLDTLLQSRVPPGAAVMCSSWLEKSENTAVTFEEKLTLRLLNFPAHYFSQRLDAWVLDRAQLVV